MFLVVAVLVLLNVTIMTDAVGYSKKSIVLISNKLITLRLYQTGKVDLTRKNKTHRLIDDGQCRYAGMDKYGDVYFLLNDGCLYGLDYKNQYGLGYNKFKKFKLIKLAKNVKTVKANKYGYTKSYIKRNHKTYKLTPKHIKKIWKQAKNNYQK